MLCRLSAELGERSNLEAEAVRAQALRKLLQDLNLAFKVHFGRTESSRAASSLLSSWLTPETPDLHTLESRAKPQDPGKPFTLLLQGPDFRAMAAHIRYFQLPDSFLSLTLPESIDPYCFTRHVMDASNYRPECLLPILSPVFVFSFHSFLQEASPQGKQQINTYRITWDVTWNLWCHQHWIFPTCSNALIKSKESWGNLNYRTDYTDPSWKAWLPHLNGRSQCVLLDSRYGGNKDDLEKSGLSRYTVRCLERATAELDSACSSRSQVKSKHLEPEPVVPSI